MADINPLETPPAELPPAAVVVTQSPRELQLEQELETEKQARRLAEQTAAEHEDRARQLVDLDSRRPAPPVKPKKEKMNVRFPTILHEAADEDEGEN